MAERRHARPRRYGTGLRPGALGATAAQDARGGGQPQLDSGGCAWDGRRRSMV